MRQCRTDATWPTVWMVMATLVLGGLVAVGAAQPQSDARISGHSFRPSRRPATDALIRQLRVPPGFQVSVFARDLGNARMMSVDDEGTVYLSRPEQRDVIALRDRDGDGHADEQHTVLSGLDGAHGLALHEGRLYVAGVHRVVAGELRGGAVGRWQTLIDNLPDGGQHGKRTIGIGPDGRLYVSVGSSCNACDETNPEHATIVRARADGSERAVFARGLRNTIGFAWHPETRELWGMDHGSDWRGDDQPPEELNRLVEGADYGWPLCFADRRPDPLFDSQKIKGKAAHCRKTEPSVLNYQAHSAPIGMVFYTGRQFPAEYRDDAFVAMRGSWNRKPATGYKVVRIRFEHGRPTRFEDFLTGFLIEEGRAQFGRLAGVAVARDGALLFSDDENGMIYRVTFRASAAR
jgi:glucose/arabinose dehydrogenase